MRREIAAFWDATVAACINGADPAAEHADLCRWFAAYSGAGRGAVTADALPEPYIGPLDPRHGEPRLLTLGLNPGEADLAFQGPHGIFSEEMRARGGYGAWAVTEPYLRDPWKSRHRPNRYHLALQTFAQRWCGDPHVKSRDVLVFELYPWHSTAVTRVIRPEPQIIDRYVWQPIADLDEPVIFGFGAPWQRVATGLGLNEESLDISLSVAARRVRIFRLPSGQQLAVVWQAGYNGPPGGRDVALLRRALSSDHRRPNVIPPPAATSSPTKTRDAVRSDGPHVPATAHKGSGKYSEFWLAFTERLRRERPRWRTGKWQRNDLPMFGVLPESRFKFNFSRQGLRVELLLTSTSADVNARRLEVLRQHVSSLQSAVGALPRLQVEPLPGRTQSRLAAYLPDATVDQVTRWTDYEAWLIDVLDRLEGALRAVRDIAASW